MSQVFAITLLRTLARSLVACATRETCVTSKRNLVVVRLGCSRFRWRGRARRRASAAGFVSITTALATADQLHAFGDNATLAAFLSRLFVIPGIELQPAFDEDGTAFLQIFADDLRRAAPERYIDKGGFLALLPRIGRVDTVHGEADLRDGGSLRRVAYLRIARQVADQNDFVKAGHAPVLANLFCLGDFFRAALVFLRQLLVMLAVNFRVELELGAQFRDQLRVGLEHKIDIVTGVDRPGDVGKMPLIHLLDLFDVGAFLLKF